MGTRAAFWEGDLRNLETRKWLGAICWDGYPDGLKELRNVKTVEDFHSFVESLKSRKDWCPPEEKWPFPWTEDVCLTDYNYCWDRAEVIVHEFHCAPVSLNQYDSDAERQDDASCLNVPAPAAYNGSLSGVMVTTAKTDR